MKAIKRISGLENVVKKKRNTLKFISEETKVAQRCRHSLWGFGGSQAGLGNVGGQALVLPLCTQHWSLEEEGCWAK